VYPSPPHSAAISAIEVSTLRRLVKLARRLGLVGWTIDVEGMKAQPYRNTTEPGADGWRPNGPWNVHG